MPEATAEPEIGNISHIFDKVLPMSEDDMEGGTLPSAKEPSSTEKPPARTREAAKFQEKQPAGDTPEPVSKTPPEKTESTLPDFLFDKKEETTIVPTEEGEKEPVRETVPEELKGDKRKNFEKLVNGKYEAEKKAHTLALKLREAEAKAAQGDPTSKTRIEALEKQVSEQSELVARSNLKMHPLYQQNYTIPRQQHMDIAIAALKDAEVDPELLESALALKGKAKADKFNELYEGVSNKFLLGKITSAVGEIEKLDAGNEVAMQHAALYNKHFAENEANAKAKQAEEYETNTRATLKESTRFLRDDYGMEVLKTTDDPKFSWWNEQVAKIESTAEQIMLKISDPKQLTIAAHLAAACVPYRTMFKQEHELRLKLEKKLADRDGSEPPLGGERPTLDGADGDEKEDENTPLATSVIKSIRKFERKGQ